MNPNTLNIPISPPTTRPTPSGYIMMLILLAMLIASANYGNNMAFILTFLLLSMYLVSLAYSRNALKGLEIANLMPEPVFAGDMLKMNLELHNRSRRKRYGLWLCHGDAKTPEDFSGPFVVDGGSNTTVFINIPTPDRGRFTLRRIHAATLYPLGLFAARGAFRLEKIYLVYPRPEGFRPWPDNEQFEPEGGEGFLMKGGDDFTGVHPYRQGESMRHIDWKAVARGRSMNVKEFTGGGASKIFFDYTTLTGMPAEERLSQICKWVLEADEQGAEFGMLLPGIKLTPDSGPAHTLKCLEELAMFGQKQ